MAASRLPEEIDLKDLQFCDACAEHLKLAAQTFARDE
jgi:predicted Zn-dependent protease